MGRKSGTSKELSILLRRSLAEISILIGMSFCFAHNLTRHSEKVAWLAEGLEGMA
jgi:hypothetical protein